MIITRTLPEFYTAYSDLENKNSIGFVPTMGRNSVDNQGEVFL